MKTLLIANGIHHLLIENPIKKIDIVNKRLLSLCEAHHFLTEVNPVIEAVLITDEALSQQLGRDKEDMLLLLEWIANSNKPKAQVVVLTRIESTRRELHSLSSRYDNFSIITSDLLRISRLQYMQAFELLLDNKHPVQKVHKPDNRSSNVEKEKRRSFLDCFKSKPKPGSVIDATDRLSKDIENISRGISRTVAITGHRGSGLTSTAVNIACEAGKRGLSAVIVDMDVEYRSTNMYFSRFHEQSQRHEELSASLIRSLARPQDYMTTAFNISDNLWLISLGYDFHDKRLMEQFYNNNKLIGLLSVLRTKFNLVILDMPMDLFRTFRESMIHMDMFGLCVSNNLHSILSTLRNVEGVLDQEGASYLNAKSKVIVTKYNDRSRFQREILTPDKVSEVMTSGLSDCFTYEMSVAGSVPYSNDFDSQIESDVPVVNANADYESAYGNILLRLMEGVK
ncbi:hypothetical protein [Paenibacillus terrigena]|uniref:hypothetical protein n=1 Tax=Paenibacillus terrigena TaxID=369333 RepID=UPI0028D7CDE5|nr:hypothetical protein [Paenibacillus terrigena]